MVRPTRRKLEQIIEEQARGNIVLRNGRGSFEFPCDPIRFKLFIKLRSSEIEHPNCAQMEFIDEITKSRIPGGFKVQYRIDSPSRTLEWILARGYSTE